jgi:hypothetical protein
LVSCSIKIKDISSDYTQEVGKIKSMNIKKYEYKFIKMTLIVKTTIVYFDVNQNYLAKKILTENGTKETNFRYSNGLVVEKR